MKRLQILKTTTDNHTYHVVSIEIHNQLDRFRRRKYAFYKRTPKDTKYKKNKTWWSGRGGTLETEALKRGTTVLVPKMDTKYLWWGGSDRADGSLQLGKIVSFLPPPMRRYAKTVYGPGRKYIIEMLTGTTRGKWLYYGETQLTVLPEEQAALWQFKLNSR